MKHLMMIIVAICLSQKASAQSYGANLQELKVGDNGSWVFVLDGKSYQASSFAVAKYKSLLLPISELSNFPIRVRYTLTRESDVDKVNAIIITDEIEKYENVNY